jgi:hypothetical protein
MEHWLAALFLSGSAIIIAVLFFKRLDRLLYALETVNKIPPGQDDTAPTDEEFKKQAHDFVEGNKKDEELDGEIIIESLEAGRRVKVKPAEKKAGFV